MQRHDPDRSQPVVLASGNAGKLREMQQMLGDTRVELVSQRDLGLDSAEETGLTFVENALLKARHASRASGLPALADDSGLAVDALRGAPGIYSARYAGADGDDATNNSKLLEAMLDVPEALRTARFICVIVYLRHAEDPVPVICEGIWRGAIRHAPAGENGFGYDPLFQVPESGCSSAELPADEKNRLSHRGQALRALLQRWPDTGLVGP
ncbi:MAG: RdgB/HAM1 family non-canonical purine NTP pyrophosphatase [Pseudomonadota bacterium]